MERSRSRWIIGWRLLAASILAALTVSGCGSNADAGHQLSEPEQVAMGYLSALFTGDKTAQQQWGTEVDRPFVWDAIGGFAGITLPPTVMYSVAQPGSGELESQVVAIRFNGLPRHPDNPELPREWRSAEEEQAYIFHARLHGGAGRWQVANATLLPMWTEPPAALTRIGDLLLTADRVTVSSGSERGLGPTVPRELDANELTRLRAAFDSVQPIPVFAVLDREPVPARYRIEITRGRETYSVAWLSATRLTVTASLGGSTGAAYALADFRQLDRQVLAMMAALG